MGKNIFFYENNTKKAYNFRWFRLQVIEDEGVAAEKLKEEHIPDTIGGLPADMLGGLPPLIPELEPDLTSQKQGCRSGPLFFVLMDWIWVLSKM